ncbi:class I adenylate-forming enzyme family protein [Chelatococcus reniformis]|uniref:Acyl-CoA synthetase n=1 Tax=Chelatococcus reniformis TaxID=1494448 RepID=A0A916XE17_9HYPH|nr:AMP-binding protein [Chelatococcus reniformis]GGC64991.1 acyl-CoA synthetase [Chelatococcus reniformis]
MTTVVSQHVARNARKFPSRVALIDEHRSMSYAELDASANRLAHFLLARGIAPGDKVAILAKSSLRWVVAMLATAAVRATCVPVNYRLTTAEILGNLEDAECRFVFATAELAEQHLAGRIDIPIALLDGGPGPDSYDTILGRATDTPPPSSPSDDDLALIMFTGGTTGRSKGVMLRSRQVFWNTVHEALDTGMDEFSNTVLATPLHHAAALNCWLLPHLYLGARSTILGDYSADRMVEMIDRHGGTNGFTPPSMARELCLAARDEPARMRTFRSWYVGGGVLSGKDREEMHRLVPGMKIFYQYGLTEAGVIVTVLKEEDYHLAPDSIGRPFLNFEVRIAAPDMSDAKTGEEGEILVRGPSVMEGYFKRRDATRDAFHDGWLRTGDAGAMDAGGFVYFRDRIKDMVKTGGLNVYSQEVERAMQRHPKIREVGIIGLPSDRWGEEVTAVVVLRDGQAASTDELIAFAKHHLAGYKAPKKVIFVDYADMPINYSGKIMKRELRTWIAARYRGSAT